jgi:hypothetical protein
MEDEGIEFAEEAKNPYQLAVVLHDVYQRMIVTLQEANMPAAVGTTLLLHSHLFINSYPQMTITERPSV